MPIKLQRLDRELVVARPITDVFHFFARAENLERITPPWLVRRDLAQIFDYRGAAVARLLR